MSMLACLIAGLAAAGASDSDVGEWIHEDALCRMRISVSSRRGQQMRVDLPDALHSRVKGVAAYDSEGGKLPASLLSSDGQALAVWVAVGRMAKELVEDSGNGVPLPVELYLFSDDRTTVPLPADRRRPARFLRTTQSLLTRPFTDREAVLLTHEILGHERRVYAFDMEGVGKTVDRPNWQQPPERRSAVMLWSTGLYAHTKRTVTFGSDREHVAWFVFVDGQPAGSWRSAVKDESGLWGREVVLPAGPHHVDFLAVQRHGEEIPACLLRNNGDKPTAFSGDFPQSHPRVVDIQFTSGGPTVRVALTDVVRYLFEGTGADVVAVNVSATNQGGDPVKMDADLFGVDIKGHESDGYAVVAGSVLPGVSLDGVGPDESAAALRFPPRRLWLPAQRITADLRLGTMPVVNTHAAPLDITIDLSLSEDVAEPVKDRLTVDATLYDRSGTLLASETVMSGRTGQEDVSLRLDPDVARVVFTAGIGDWVVARDRVLRVLRPGASIAGLEAYDRALFQDGERALLVCRPMARLSTSVAGADLSRSMRIGLLDDFLAGEEAPGASLLPESRIGRGWKVQPVVFRESIAPGGEVGVVSDVAKFAAAARLLEMDPDVVILAVGASDLRRGRRGEAVAGDLLFLAQAVAAADARPVLVALPGLPGVSEFRSRRFALLCKELAWRLGLQVLDAHSRDMLTQFAGPGFPDTFSIAGGRVALNVPNDRGREWFCSLIEDAIADRITPRNR